MQANFRNVDNLKRSLLLVYYYCEKRERRLLHLNRRALTKFHFSSQHHNLHSPVFCFTLTAPSLFRLPLRGSHTTMDSLAVEASSSTSKILEFKSRFEAYNRLQSVAVAFGEKLPIPEIVALGGQSDGKSSLLEALLGFRFNVREVEMGTRRPLIIQMLHDPSAVEPRCRLQEEDSEEYGSLLVLGSTVADLIKSRTEAHLRKTKTVVSSKPIVMRAEYAHCPDLAIIDTPGFVLKAKKGEPENTPDEILSMVKSLASPPHRLLLFLQQSSVEWCSSLWLDAIREIDPTFRRTIIVVSKFDNRLKEFTDRRELDQYLSASGYLGENTHPFFVALPKDRGMVTNEEFRRQISQVDNEVLQHMRENINGGFDEEKFRPFIGFGCLKEYLESELQKRYKEAAPATLALLQRRCSEVTVELERINSDIQATSDVASLRRSAMLHAASISSHVGALIDGATDPAPEQWGKTTEEERLESGLVSWPGVIADIKPPNSSLRLHGGAAFERVMHEFRCASYSIMCPTVSKEKVGNILLAHAVKGGGGGVMEAAADIARATARSWLASLLETACDRLAFVLRNLFELAVERHRNRESSESGRKRRDMDGYVGFHAALRHSYNNFIVEVAKQCKQLVRHHLDSVTSPYSQACYENDFSGGYGSGPYSIYRFNPTPAVSFNLEPSDGMPIFQDETTGRDQENIPPERGSQQTTPGKRTLSREALQETEMTIPDTPPDQPCDVVHAGVKKKDKKKGHGNHIEVGGRKRLVPNRSKEDNHLAQNGGGVGLLVVNGDIGSGAGSAYSDICSAAAQYFAKIREILVERSVTSTMNSGFLTPCRDRLVVALSLDLFAVNDEKFMDMFVAPGAIDTLQNEQTSLHKRQRILQSCLHEFKSIARVL
ncbi:PREDICTED: dynamin-related protein 5A-like [Nelumbo nucifera]|uniref:Dynamin-related protein 5A-like n=1 Tax=Nelumbo nucifera TaxID=4432 RepID=A0A1U8B3Q7_NELNU|nr:PREDICTED: dynamin-related protein 5A-like [Nelumbo nucifera]